MQRLALFAGVFVALTFFGTTARATEVGNARRAGLGFAVGEPTGIVGKVFLSDENALDAGLSFYGGWVRCYRKNDYDFCGHSHFSLHADYLWETVLVRERVRLDFHIGVGGRMWFFSPDDRNSDFLLGARMPLGLDLTFDNPRFLEVYFELTPVLYIIPVSFFGVEPSLGVRFYF